MSAQSQSTQTVSPLHSELKVTMYRFVKYSIWSAIALGCLYLGGCDSSAQKPLILPPELSINEFVLQDKPHIIGESSISFLPVEGTQKDVLSKHQDERNKPLPDTSTYENFHPGYSALLNGQDIVATYYETPSITTGMGTFYKGYVEVSQEEKVLYTIQTGDSTPASSLRGLWTYDNHWVLEVVHATEKKGLFQSEMDFDLVGDIIMDGVSLNQQQKYQETFGFQLMNGKPFFFFKKSGYIGISYNGKEVPLEYTQIPHYLCCSGAALNPKIAENMVSFFTQRNETWYYVEIGVFE
jgi:hypothetical protein